MFNPLFSIFHITCRVPDGWQNACRIWKLRADHPENVEYVLGLHKRQNELPFADKQVSFTEIVRRAQYDLDSIWGPPLRIDNWADDSLRWKIAVNFNRPCIVDNANSAAAGTSGKILVSAADDLRPCEHWDTRIAEALCGAENSHIVGDGQHVLKVSHGNKPWEAKYPHIITHGIVTRAYYERLGYIAWPEYSDYGCDDDFSLQAYNNGVVIERPDIVFPHLTWLNGQRNRDAVDLHTNRQEVWDIKEKVLSRRVQEGFPEGWPEGFPR